MRPLFDVGEWRKNREEKFFPRLDALIRAAALVGPEQKVQARIDLANFYMSRGMYQEARGVTNLIISETNQGNEDPAVLMVNAVASILIDHPERALKVLASPAIGNGYDSQLWKGFAFARLEKWADAREKFKNAEFSIAALPLELQRIVTADAMRASLEVKDYGGASRRRSELDVIGIPNEMKPEIAVLRGRLAEALGHDKGRARRLSLCGAIPRPAGLVPRRSCWRSCCAAGAASSIRRILRASSRYWRSPGAAMQSN